MFAHKRIPIPLLILCAVLMLASGFLLLFALSPLPDNRLWLIIFPCLLLITFPVPLGRALQEYNRTFIEKQNAQLKAGFPVHTVKVSHESPLSIFSAHGFRDNGRGYLKKHAFSLKEWLIYRQSITWYVRWIPHLADDVRALIEKEYHDLSCLYDTLATEKRLILFIQRDTVTPADLESLNNFCMTLLRDEVNQLHAPMPIPENTPLPRVQLREQIYIHDHMILPVLMDVQGNGYFVDASALARPTTARYCTYADCCQKLQYFL